MAEDVSDPRLNAYLDGALSDEERRAFEAALAQDEHLRGALARLKRAQAAVRAAFDDMPPETPARLIDMVEEAFAARAAARKVVAFPSLRARDWRAPLAASLLITLGLGGGYILGRAGSNSYETPALGPVAPASELHALLESMPSAQDVSLGADALARAIVTLRTETGVLCREIEIDAPRVSAIGVACRDETAWRVAVLAQRPVRDGAGFAPVGDDTAAIEAFLMQAGGAEIVSLDEERALIAEGWRR